MKRKIVIGFLTILMGVSLINVTSHAASRAEIDANVQAALARFYGEVSNGRDLVNRAAGVLVFPEVVKAGIGIGGEYGEGALLINGGTADYFRLASGSVGFQFGVQVKTEVILFMYQDTLDNFRRSSGWEAGVDGSIALVTVGAGGEVDTNTINKPILGFIISNKGLMYNLTFEGTKISRIEK